MMENFYMISQGFYYSSNDLGRINSYYESRSFEEKDSTRYILSYQTALGPDVSTTIP